MCVCMCMRLLLDAFRTFWILDFRWRLGAKWCFFGFFAWPETLRVCNVGAEMSIFCLYVEFIYVGIFSWFCVMMISKQWLVVKLNIRKDYEIVGFKFDSVSEKL